ncbi:hypothetical protein HMPREF3159_07975 [Brachybacterium sp. HMSC06H03]|uniref:hypothetical protein n=1 Tax=Brachybacterium sp. HMSC06H03 TaxID=1581127 RepID=UPI0008A2CFEE|nr:hypothetical protein [Brachybacterium sp. HMSC06H03]OFT58153.1 hypothetical protein HMPREF3159_07975 [Brachybacterium sp. HMSC06H03]
MTRFRNALALLPKATRNRDLSRETLDALAIAEAVQAHTAPPNIRSEAEQIAARLTADNYTDLLDEYAKTMARREAHVALLQQGQLMRALDARLLASLTQERQNIAKRLTPTFTQAANTLTQVAHDLPHGPGALDPTKVLEANAGTAYQQARDSLNTLYTIALIHHSQRDHGQNFPAVLVPLIPMLDVPEATVQLRDAEGQRYLNSDDELQRIAPLVHLGAAAQGSLAVTLLDVARGDFPGISFKLATDAAEVRKRAASHSRAHTAKRDPSSIGGKPMPTREQLTAANV